MGGKGEKSAKAGGGPAEQETLEQQGGGNAVSDVSTRSDGEGEDSRIRAKIQDLLDTAINPAVAGHGGVVSLVDVKDKMVYLQMGGGCQGCGIVDGTLKQGIETLIREELPEVVEIPDVTDHARGAKPYFAASVDLRGLCGRFGAFDRTAASTVVAASTPTTASIGRVATNSTTWRAAWSG